MNTPNKITISRIILVFALFFGLFIFSFFMGNVSIPSYGPHDAPINLVYLIIFIVFVIAASTDTLDGYLARKNNQVTDLGKFLDPIADKMLVNSTLIFLCVPFCGTNQMTISVFAVILFIVRDLVVDTVRLVAAKKNIVLAANIFGKLKTVAQMIAIPVVLLNGWPFSYFDANWIKGLRFADFLIYIALFLSLLSGIIYVVKNKKVFKETKKVDTTINIKKLFELCDKENLTFGSVESFTGGLFGSLVTSIPGSSKYYKGSIISYCEEIKENIVGVPAEMINKYTVISKEVAKAMCKEGQTKLNTDICVSFTGNAGPTTDKGCKPVGLIYIGIAYNGDSCVYEYNIDKPRNELRKEAVDLAIEKIIEIILKK